MGKDMFRAAMWLLALAVAGAVSVVAAAEGRLKIKNVSQLRVFEPHVDVNLKPRPIFEVNPVFIRSPARSVVVSTSYSWICSYPERAAFSQIISLRNSVCHLVSLPATISNMSAPLRANNDDMWRRNYNGIVAATILDGSNVHPRIFFAVQGENKNEIIGGQKIHNTVMDDDKSDCFSEARNGAYFDCWKFYFSFVNAAIATPSSDGSVSAADMGPIIWPSAGYLRNGKRISAGVRSPSLFSDSRWIYVFYNDTSSEKEQGRGGGLKVARASASDQAPNFVPFFSGTFDVNNRSLPPNFDKKNIAKFLELSGGKADPLWSPALQTTKFRVAKIKNSKFYIGVSESGGFNNMIWSLDLRLSPDLVHWSEPVRIPGATAADWKGGNLHYPDFYWDDVAAGGIDIEAFSIIGNGGHGRIVKIDISASLEN